MIEKIEIENFKSIKELSLDLGRINVIIGANGTGKTNILESIVIGAAAMSNKLEYEYLSNRLRYTEPEFMVNAFTNINKDIILSYGSKNANNTIMLEYKSDTWVNTALDNVKLALYLSEELNKIKDSKDIDEDVQKRIFKIIKDAELLSNYNETFSDFNIYTPEYSFLNKFEEQGQILPLGLKGEGLFNALKKILTDETKIEQLNVIKENLQLLDWFEDFKIPKDNMFNEHKIAIQDKFLESNKFFDQKSSNEGFLFLLFYLVLFTSENTPKFFAIDNIDTGFNPKLCRELIVTLTDLATKYDKQVIFTTHNPAILDGLDLKDDDQRLFVVRRNRDGSTAIERIEHKPKSKMKLSELWMSGIIGGLPDNF